MASPARWNSDNPMCPSFSIKDNLADRPPSGLERCGLDNVERLDHGAGHAETPLRRGDILHLRLA
jgi:hypothetical protein